MLYEVQHKLIFIILFRFLSRKTDCEIKKIKKKGYAESRKEIREVKVIISNK